MITMRAKEVYRKSVLKIIAIESIEYHHQQLPFSAQFFVKLAPVAVIVINQNGTNAFSLTQSQFDLADAIRNVPGLGMLLGVDWSLISSQPES